MRLSPIKVFKGVIILRLMKNLIQNIGIFYILLMSLSVYGQITYTDLYSNATFDAKAIDVTLPTGVIPATSDVTANGSADYSIPIVLPPGTNGVVPTLNIAYSSQGSNGVLGQGWHISGLSVITRSPKSLYFDGTVSSVSLTSNDPFAIDGTRLLGKTGTYGADGATYATESENFAQITSKGLSNGSPIWFEVVSKDGLIMEYGNTADSRTLNHDGTKPLFWRLNKIRYNDGNYIEFKYTSVDLDYRVDEINYSGNSVTGLLPYNKVKFNYSLRFDITTSFEVNTAVVNKFLLNDITITTETQAFKTYVFKYAKNNTTSFLKEVIERGSDNSALNSTIFKYGDAPIDFDPITSAVIVGQVTDMFSGDFDADGYSDLLAATYLNGSGGIRYHTELKIYKRTATNPVYTLTATQSLPVSSTAVPKSNVNTATGYAYTDYRNYNNFYTMDFTGDGIDDIATASTPFSGSNRVLNSIKIYLPQNNATSFNPQPISILPYTGYEKIHPSGHFLFTGDFNGDGIGDILTLLAPLNGSSYIPHLYFGSISSSFGTVGITGSYTFGLANWADAVQINVVDFDGDGKSDLMITKSNGCEIFTFDNYVAKSIYFGGALLGNYISFPCDFNGDRKTDFLYRSNSTQNNSPWYKIVSTGKSFSTPALFTFNRVPDITGGGGDRIVILDANGDGKTDIVHAWNNFVNGVANDSRFDLYYCKGDDFHYQQHPFNKIYGLAPLIPYDLNGDGRSEIISRISYTQPFDILQFKKNGQELLLQKAKNGMGHITEWSYKRMNEAGTFYIKGGITTQPVNNIQLPMYLVSDFKIPDGIGGNVTIQYSYEEAKLHKEGKGYLGMKKMSATNLVTGYKITTENEFNSTYYLFAPYKVTKSIHYNGQILNEVTNNNQFLGLGGKRFWYRLNGTTENKVFEGRTVTTSNTFDANGNVLVNTVNNNGVETTVTTTTYGMYGTPIPAKPTSVSIERTRTGQAAYSATTTFSYNALGQIIGKTEFSGLLQNVVSSYTYNTLGNQTGIVVSPANMSQRTFSYTYDTKGRFQQGVTNPLGQSTASVYDTKWGKPLSITGVDNLTTTHQYDAFGRLTSSTFPEGFTVTKTYGWDVNATEGTIGYTLTTHPGKPDTKVWYDLLEREKKVQTEGFQNLWITEKTTYDARGNVATMTAPYKNGETALVTTNLYDGFDRILSASNSLRTVTNTYSYASGNLTVSATTVTSNPSVTQTTTKVTDAAGRTISTTDNGGTLTFTYNSQGNPVEIKIGATTLVTNEYDAYARQTKMTDINAGITQYAYDALGQLISQTTPNGQTSTRQYDLLGRMTQRVGQEGTTLHEYFPSGTAATNKIKKVTGFAGNLEEYTYDSYGRMATKTETVDAAAHINSFSYNIYGDVVAVAYPSGFVVNTAYDANGYITTLKNGNNTVTMFNNTGMNGFNQYISYILGDGKTTQKTYNFGIPTRFFATGVQDLNLNWDYASGNLNSRNDIIKNKTETFVYDNLNRLTTATVAGLAAMTMTYSANGNIISKTDAGSYSYHPTKINAVASVTNSLGNYSGMQQDIIYTAFLQPATLTENNYQLQYTYAADYQRIKGVLKQNGIILNTRYYFGNYEKNVSGTTTRHIHYISAGQGLVAIVERLNGADTYYYAYTDHLGSILTMTNSGGTIETEQNFDPWGRRRNPTTWAYTSVPSLKVWLYRGFTGHEHLLEFGLVNMNGRLYDPLAARMLSPDNNVQSPDFTQNYNRFSYALNNPLRYTDPDGQIIFAAVMMGAMLGGMIGGATAIVKGTNVFRGFAAGALGGALIGAGAASVASAVANVALANASSYLPSLNVPLYEDRIFLSISPSMLLGAKGFGVGLNITGTMNLGGMGSVSTSLGLTYFGNNPMTKTHFWEKRHSNSFAIGGRDFRIVGGTTRFWGGGVDQKLGNIGFAGKDWSVSYENDGGKPLSESMMDLGDGNDNYRTAAITLQYKDFSAGIRIFTGRRDYSQDKREPLPGYPYGVVSNPEINDYKFAAAYLGYQNYRVGWDHYKIGHAVQNKFAHEFLQPQAFIPWKSNMPGRTESFYRPNSFYGGFFTTNPFTNW